MSIDAVNLATIFLNRFKAKRPNKTLHFSEGGYTLASNRGNHNQYLFDRFSRKRGARQSGDKGVGDP
jgi:hypothetical protein